MPATPKTAILTVVRPDQTTFQLTILVRAPVGPAVTDPRLQSVANGPPIDAAVIFSDGTAKEYLRDMSRSAGSGEEVIVDAFEPYAREFLVLVGANVWPGKDDKVGPF